MATYVNAPSTPTHEVHSDTGWIIGICIAAALLALLLAYGIPYFQSTTPSASSNPNLNVTLQEGSQAAPAAVVSASSTNPYANQTSSTSPAGTSAAY